MKTRLLTAAAFAALLVPALPAAAQAPGDDTALRGESCDRACMLGLLTQYMDAMRADSPSSAPLAHNVVFSENNVILPVGKGVWGRIDKVDAVGMEAADPKTRNAAWFGSIVENGEPAIFAVRIHVTDGKIDEVESVVHRKLPLPAPFGDVTNMVHDPEFNAVLPPEQRKSRARLIDMADAYFDTVQINDGHVFANFDPDCGRLENGISTTTRTARSSANFVEGCEAQFKLGMYRINKRIRERRYPLVDEERGVVVSTGFFDHDNELNRYVIKNGREIKTALNWPNSISLLEAFRIKEGAISRIEAVFTYVPYFMHNPWAGIGSKPPQHLPDPKACDSRCLTDMTTRTVQAYATRKWNDLPWSDRVAYNENSSGMPIGEGSWLTINAVDKSPLIVTDPQTGNAVWIGRVDNHDQPSWGAITVQADGDTIGGVRALFHHKEYGAPYAEPGAAPSFSILSNSQRTTREAMVREVDAFYRALNAKDGTAPANLGSGCKWNVNGLDLGACEPPFTQRLIAGLEQVRDIELLAVDEARGLVVMSTFEDFPAHEKSAAGQPHWPRTLQVTELFRFEKGKIARIDAYTAELPYGMKPHGEALVVDTAAGKYYTTLMKPTP
jgi:hypothetical protein